MYPVPKVHIPTKTDNYDLVQKFCNANFWEEQYRDLFTDDVAVDFPHAPPGMLQHLSSFEFLEAFRWWLRNTVRTMAPICEPTIIPTTDPNVFWAIRFCKGTVYWAQKECAYQNEHAIKITIRDGKIAALKDYFNAIEFYNALGISLPGYIFDPKEEAPSVRMPEGQPSKLSPELNRKRAIDNFVNPIEFDASLESIYTSDVTMVCPYVPFNMPEVYQGASFDTQTDWMFYACPEWTTPDESVGYYQSVDPNVIIVESEGYGRTTWSHKNGHYHQRELQIVFLEQEKVKHFRVYFNSMNKFASMNQMIPSFPYMNF